MHRATAPAPLVAAKAKPAKPKATDDKRIKGLEAQVAQLQAQVAEAKKERDTAQRERDTARRELDETVKKQDRYNTELAEATGKLQELQKAGEKEDDGGGGGGMNNPFPPCRIHRMTFKPIKN